MPAHHGITDILGVHLGALLQHSPFRSLRQASTYGGLFEHMKKSEKGTEKLFQGSDRKKVTADDGIRLLELERKKREHQFVIYSAYRAYMDTKNPYQKYGVGKAIFTEGKGTLRDVMDNLDDGQYNEKKHEKFKIEWDMYLKPDTVFDRIVRQILEKDYVVNAITYNMGSKRLKRIEAKKPGISTKILWTDT